MTGYVRTPGAYPLKPNTDGRREAIAQAGRPHLARHLPADERILRKDKDGKEIEIDAKTADLVRPNDTIKISQRLIYGPARHPAAPLSQNETRHRARHGRGPLLARISGAIASCCTSRVARPPGSLQADCDRRSWAVAAVPYDGGVVVFRRLDALPSREFPSGLVLAAVLPWQFFSTGLRDDRQPPRQRKPISKVYFPRLIIPALSGRAHCRLRDHAGAAVL